MTRLHKKLYKPLKIKMERRPERSLRWMATVHFEYGSPIISYGSSKAQVMDDLTADMFALLRIYGYEKDFKLSPEAKKFKREILSYFEEEVKENDA